MNKRKQKKKSEPKKNHNIIKLCMFLAATSEMFWVQPCFSKHLCQQFPKCAASQTTVASKGSHLAAWDLAPPFNLSFQVLLSSANNQTCTGSEAAASWMGAGNHWQAGEDRRLCSSSLPPLLALACLHAVHSHFLLLGLSIHPWPSWVLQPQLSSSKRPECC